MKRLFCHIVGCLILLLVGLNSCTFESDDEFFVEVDQSGIVTPEIDFNNSPDTIYMRGDVRVNINISQDVDIYEFVIFIDGQEIGRGNSYLGGANVESEQFNDGYHSILLRVFSRTNTGSLGDQLGVEALVTETKKTVLIDNAPITTQVKGFENVDGILTFSWDEYTSLNFEEYQVVFSAPYESFGQTITSTNQTSVTVPEFVGGSINATFYLRAKGEEIEVSTSFTDDLGVSFVLVDQQLQLTVTANNYVAFDRYELVHNNSLNGPSEFTRYAIENRLHDEESIAIEYEFPVSYNFSMYAISVSGAETYLNGSFFNEEVYLLDFDEDLRYYFFDNTILHIKVQESEELDDVILYDRSTGNVIEERIGEIALSPDGTQLFEYSNGTMIQYNPATLEAINAFEIAPILTMEGEFRRLYVSNSGKLLLYSFLSHDPFGQRTYYRSYFIDANTRSFVKSWNHSSRFFPTRTSSLLSQNGLMVDSDLFFISYFPYSQNDFPDIYNGVATSQDELSGVSRMVAPLHTSDSYLVAEASSLTKRDYINHSVSNTLSLDGSIVEIFSNFDDLCSVILLKDAKYYLVIVDTETLVEIERIPFNSSVLDGEKYMTNNMVFIEGRNEYVYDLEVNQ